jgi:Tol biopolymer transport system component
MVSGRDRRTRPGLFRIDVRTAAVSDLLRPDAGVRNSRAEWSADGQSIFYVRKSTTCSCVVRRELATGHEVEVYRMPPSGLQVRLAVAPNGQSIAVLSSAGGQPTLRILPSGGGASRVLYEGDDLAWLSFVGWTPDSQRVLFGRQRSSLEVWTIPAAGGQPTRTGLAMQGLRDLRMSPRGDRVVFTAGEDTFEVWVMEHFLPVGGSASTSPAARR